MNRVLEQLEAASILSKTVGAINYEAPVISVYNPLTYAWNMFRQYVEHFGGTRKETLFLGMNPGPWGMAQTGVPFGEISVVRDWLKLSAPIEQPQDVHPKYPIQGLDCRRSEVSGKRLWGLFKTRFGTPEAFFKDHFVVNYCPLLFIAASQLKNGGEGARNLTPDKLSPQERSLLYKACGEHLQAIVAALCPHYVVGVGNFATERAEEALRGTGVRIAKILHPSPASPKSNMDWAGEAARQLKEQEIW